MEGTIVLEPTSTEKADDGMNGFLSWRTTLFNCNCHSYQQVETQLMKATRCTKEQAKAFAKEIDTNGSAVVFTGCRERCEAVSMTLDVINLRTDVHQ